MKRLEFKNLSQLLAFNIKYYRYVNNLSQELLAEKSNLSPEYISRIERELHSPSNDKLEAIALGLNIKPYELFMNIDRDEEILKKIFNYRQYNQK